MPQHILNIFPNFLMPHEHKNFYLHEVNYQHFSPFMLLQGMALSLENQFYLHINILKTLKKYR